MLMCEDNLSDRQATHHHILDYMRTSRRETLHITYRFTGPVTRHRGAEAVRRNNAPASIAKSNSSVPLIGWDDRRFPEGNHAEGNFFGLHFEEL